MAAKSYYEQLKDPRWQKKRLEVLEEGHWSCSDCASAEKTLHVHHTFYERGRNVWEYPTHSLVVLCEDCHAKAQALMTELHRAIGRMSFTFASPRTIVGVIDGQIMSDYPNTRKTVVDYYHAEGIGMAFGVTPEFIINHRDANDTISGDEIHRAIHAGIQDDDTLAHRAKHIAEHHVINGPAVTLDLSNVE